LNYKAQALKGRKPKPPPGFETAGGVKKILSTRRVSRFRMTTLPTLCNLLWDLSHPLRKICEW